MDLRTGEEVVPRTKVSNDPKGHSDLVSWLEDRGLGLEATCVYGGQREDPSRRNHLQRRRACFKSSSETGRPSERENQNALVGWLDEAKDEAVRHVHRGLLDEVE